MDPLSALIDALRAEGRLRVWSLVTTVFGDAVMHRGGRIRTAQLLELLGRIGIEEGAVRTALSRLAQDGWIESERDGRRSLYKLTGRARAETEAASASIYRGPGPEPAVWSLVLADAAPRDALALGGQAYLVAGETTRGIAVTGTIAAGHALIAERAMTAEHRAALEALYADLEALPAPPSPPLDAMAARVLLIHRWRRIVLRFPEFPKGLLPAGMRDPRAALAEAYPPLFDASESWIDAPEPARTLSRFLNTET